MSALPLEQGGCEEHTIQQDDDTYQESEVSEESVNHGADGADTNGRTGA